MADMKLTDAEKKGTGKRAAEISPSSPDYPYGLVITLDERSLKKLGLSSLPEVDDEMEISGSVKVISVSSSEGSGYKQRSVQLQITDLDVGEEQESDEERTDRMATKLYGRS